MKKLALGALFAGLVACGGEDKPKPMIVDSPMQTVDAVTPAACDPLTQTGCEAGQKCGWVILQEEPFVGSIECVMDGTVAVGQACMYGAAGAAGFSNCVKGSECVAGTCKSICDNNGGDPMCDANHACSNYNNLFETSDMTVAGVCDPKCDPLTQRHLAPPNAEACGSTDPAMPNVGCYTSDFVDFTCARVPMMAKGKINYDTAYGPSAGTAFVNGCEAGYVPGIRKASGSMDVACMGLCAAKKTDRTLITNADGDIAALGKLHNQPAPRMLDATCQVGRKGTSATGDTNDECRFAWFFNVGQDGTVPESMYNDTLGLCFRPKLYNYDDDGNAGTPNIPFPSCTELPPTTRDAMGNITPPANCTCDPMTGCSGMGCPQGLAHEWGCYSLTEASGPMPFTDGKFHVRSTMEFRPAYGAGKAFRHILQ